MNRPLTVPKITYPPPRQSAPPSSSVAPAIIGGVLAAVAAAAIWTGVVLLTEYEIGWLAWGVGALVGAVMAKLTPVRGPKLAIYAALLAALGLAIGKVATVRAALPTYGRDAVLENEEFLIGAFALEMKEGERFSPELSVQLASLSSSDSVPDALGQQMFDEARARAENATEEERGRVATSFANRVLTVTSLSQQFLASLGLFDILWFFLAIGTAWKMMRGE
jgi:hypothetical protein